MIIHVTQASACMVSFSDRRYLVQAQKRKSHRLKPVLLLLAKILRKTQSLNLAGILIR